MAISYVCLWATPPAWSNGASVEDLIAYSGGALLLGLMWAGGQRARRVDSLAQGIELLIVMCWLVVLVTGPSYVTTAWLVGREEAVWWALLASTPASAAYLNAARKVDAAIKARNGPWFSRVLLVHHLALGATPLSLFYVNSFIGIAALGAVVVAYGGESFLRRTT